MSAFTEGNPNQYPIYAITPVSGRANLAAASAGALGLNTNAQTVFTSPAAGAGIVGTRIDQLVASSTDTAIINLFVQVQSAGGVVSPLGIVNVPANSGNLANVLSVNLLNPLVLTGVKYDNNGNPYIDLVPGDALIVSTLGAMTALKNCYVSARGANYQ